MTGHCDVHVTVLTGTETSPVRPDDEMHSSNKVGRGENEHAELTVEGLGDKLLAFFDKLGRGLEMPRIRTFVADVIAEARAKGDPELVKNLFVLAFHTRWCRGGKGERKIFYYLLLVLYEKYAEVIVDLVELMPTYGYWKDLLNLLLESKNFPDVDYAPLHRKVFLVFSRQLKIDEEEPLQQESKAAPRSSRSWQSLHRRKADNTVNCCRLTRKSASICFLS